MKTLTTLYEVAKTSLLSQADMNDILSDNKFLSEFGFDKKDAIEDLNYYCNYVNHLQTKGGFIYRLIFAKNKHTIKLGGNIGNHWTIDLAYIDNMYDMLSDAQTDDTPNAFLIKALIAPNGIDIKNSIESYIALPNEHEVNLNKIAQIKKIKIDTYTLA